MRRLHQRNQKRDLQRAYLELYQKKAELALKANPGGVLSPADKAAIAKAERRG